MKVTLGPKGRYVVLDKKWGAPTITNDGVTVARDVELDDPYENLGAQLAKEVATKTNDIAGDGTTATVLAQALVHEGLRAVASGYSPVGLKRGIDAAVSAVEVRLRENSREIQTTQDMANIATISARDEQIGTLIAEAFDKVGKDGVITVDESQTFGTELEFTEGMQFDKGYLSPYFVTDPDRIRPRGPLHLDQLGQDLVDDGSATPVGEGHRRFRHAVPGGRGWTGGAVHPGGQQDRAPSPPSRSKPRRSVTVARPCSRTSRS